MDNKRFILFLLICFWAVTLYLRMVAPPPEPDEQPSAKAPRPAETVADTMGWDTERVGQEVANYQAFLEKDHRFDIGASGRSGWT